MELILLMVGASIALSALFVLAFILAAGRGQFDDLDSPAKRILHDQPGNISRDPK